MCAKQKRTECADRRPELWCLLDARARNEQEGKAYSQSRSRRQCDTSGMPRSVSVEFCPACLVVGCDNQIHWLLLFFFSIELIARDRALPIDGRYVRGNRRLCLLSTLWGWDESKRILIISQ